MIKDFLDFRLTHGILRFGGRQSKSYTWHIFGGKNRRDLAGDSMNTSEESMMYGTDLYRR